MIDNFYRAFEERYYAPRNVIKGLRKQYLPFIKPLESIYPGAQTYDAGCGRGEWLELMLEQGFAPIGIDLDEGMLEACRDNNLPGKQGDAVEYIVDLEDDSMAVISAFHVVEHIDFEALRLFAHHAWRALKPGGILIMETPNPENITVATKNFYLDPTHKTPIPSELLSFVAEYAGFERVKVLRLQESKELAENYAPTLNDVISGASPDYAVVAQKKAKPEVMAQFDEVFSKEYGLPLVTLAERYHNAVQAQAEQAQAQAEQAQAQAGQFNQQLQAVYSSGSWRITAPLRWTAFQLRLLRQQGTKNRARALAKKFVIKVIAFINARPALKQNIVKVLHKTGLRDKLQAIYRARLHGAQSGLHASRDPIPTQVAHLTPHAQQIYHDLQAAITQSKEQH